MLLLGSSVLYNRNWVHYRGHKYLPVVATLKQINQFTTYFLKIHFNTLTILVT